MNIACGSATSFVNAACKRDDGHFNESSTKDVTWSSKPTFTVSKDCSTAAAKTRSR
jgi:hypothetical protein